MARRKSRIPAFLFGIFFGILLTVGSIAYGGYWAYNNLSVNKAEEITRSKITFLDGILGAESEFKSYSIKKIVEEVGTVPGLTFAEFQTKYTVTLPEDISFIGEALKDVQISQIPSSFTLLLDKVQLGHFLGGEYKNFDENADIPDGADPMLWELRTYTVSGETGINTFANEMTLGKFENLFGFELPDLLESIDRDTNILDLGEEINNLAIREIIEEPASTPDEFSPSANITNAIRDAKDNDGEYYTLSNISELFASITDDITVQDIIKRPYDPLVTANPSVSEGIMYKIWETDATITGLSSELSGIIDDLLISDVIKLDSVTPGTMSYNMIHKLTTATNPNNGDAPFKVTEIALAIEQLEIADILVVGSGGGMGNNIITALTTAVKSDEPTDPDYNVKYKIKEIDQALNKLTVLDVFGTGTGFVSLLNPDTKLSDMDSAAENVFLTKKMSDFHNAGLIDLGETPSSHPAYDMSLQDVLDFMG